MSQQKIIKLTKELNEHNRKYYVLNSPALSDFEFDQLLKELQRLEEEFPEFADSNSPTKRVGGDVTKNFPSVTHRFPMLSLSNSYSKEEIIDNESAEKAWNEGIPLESPINVIEVEYENWKLHLSLSLGSVDYADSGGIIPLDFL